MLGRKQKIANSDWVEAIAHIEDAVPLAVLDNKIRETISDIRKKTSGKKVAYAWSGGKDSLVLGSLCEQAGISDCVLITSKMEYTAFLEWVQGNKPPGLEIVNTGQDLKWLQNHQEMLFPQDSATAAKWFHIVQHRGQEKYYKEHGLDMLLLGRRKADGNYVGPGTNLYTNRQGITRFSPLADWSHEEILAYIHFFHISTPPIYGWRNGYLCGTHPWPARQWTGSIENGWNEVYEIEPAIVEEAAQYIESARIFLDGLREGRTHPLELA